MRNAIGKYWLAAILVVGVTTALSAAEPPFTIKIAASEVVKAGSDLRIRILLTNTSDHEISFPRCPAEDLGEVFSEVEVRDAAGSPVPETRYYRILKGKLETEDRPKPTDKFEPLGFHGSVILFDVKPGETLKDGIVLNKLFDVSKPGSYTVLVKKQAARSPTVVASNTITVNVTK